MKQATGLLYLSDLSPKDKRWDDRRAEVNDYSALYRRTKYHTYATRMGSCSGYLVFGFKVGETGFCELKLQAARFCRVPLCPVCQWRRALKWNAKTFKILPQVREKYPKSRFIFLTLTVETCELTDLRETLAWMNKSWAKLLKRKEWIAQGWIRTTELTRSHDDKAHPHFHCLLMVPPGYFSTGYISQERWRELWRDSLKVSYLPQVSVKAIRPSSDMPEELKGDPLAAAIVETIKYSVKPSDILRGSNCQKPGERVRMDDQEWLVKLTDELHKMRKIATGGVLKEYLKVLEEEQDSDSDDLIHINDTSEADPDSPTVQFNWSEKLERYHVKPDRQVAEVSSSGKWLGKG